MKTLIRISLLICLSVLAGCKFFTDMEMEKLCKKDGGIKIYEQVKLPKEMFSRYGNPNFFNTVNRSENVIKVSGNGYESMWESQYLRRGSPSLRKDVFSVVRQSDGKLLGTLTSYARHGGDVLPRLGPDSAKRCPKDLAQTDLWRSIFKKQD